MLPETTTFTSFSAVSSVPFVGDTASHTNTSSCSSLSSSILAFCKLPPLNPKLLHQRPAPVRFVARASSGSSHFLGDDAFGHYPWESSDPGDPSIQWVPEERVTLFTADGLVQFGGNLVPRRISASDKKDGKMKGSQRFQRFQESDYMDPNQVLCLGALFDIAATNGLDMGRRLCIFGFCRSIEMLSDVVEDTVLEYGGEVVTAEKGSRGGFHEKLTMKVAVPLLWGVPPASERLHLAVRSGGGIVDKMYWQWDFV